MIKVENLVFEYPEIRALDDVSFHVREHDITALVGPNGAGKTTLLRCLAGLETPLSGSITINDIDVLAEPRLAHEHIGYLPDFYGRYADLTLHQSLSYTAMAHNIPAEQVAGAVEKAAERLQISDRLSDKVGSLSRGLGQRLAIAQACVHEPKVLLLDEPASGLDPEARKSLSDLFLQLRDQGITLVVSSHILAELEEYSTSMAIVRDGRIIEHRGLAHDHREKMVVRVQFSEEVLESTTLLEGLAEVELMEQGGDYWLLKIDKDIKCRERLLRELVNRNMPICSFAEEKVNMQERYLEKMQKQIKGGRA